MRFLIPLLVKNFKFWLASILGIFTQKKFKVFDRSGYNYAIFCLALVFINGCSMESRTSVKSVKVNDVELAYMIRGSGPTLVMIMGFRGTMAIWDPALLDLLEKRYKLILFDNRGAGLSSDTKDDRTTIEQMAEDTIGLLKSLGIEKAHVLGWSMGSRIAMEVAFKNPEMVDHLILCSPSPGGKYRTARTGDAYKKLTAPVLTPEEGLALIFPQNTKGKEAATAYYDRLEKAILSGNVPNDIIVNEQTVERQVRALEIWEKDDRVYQQLSGIKNPTLVAGGADDDLDPWENVLTVSSRIPLAWSAYFVGSGHNFASQDHQRFSDLINVFINSTKR